jgi:hypothetical protein
MMMVFDYDDNCYDDNDGYGLSVTCIVYDEFHDCNLMVMMISMVLMKILLLMIIIYLYNIVH